MNDLAQTKESGGFLENLPPKMVIGDTYAERLLLREYGAVFVARGGAIPADRIVFRNESEVAEFQGRLDIERWPIGGFELELQAPAMTALMNAVNEAAKVNLSVSPRGADSARRNYTQTIELWASRVEPALDHWLKVGRLTEQTVNHIRSLAPYDQVDEVLALEKQQIWFAKDLMKSIIYSVAPPGTSQHLSLLAFDVKEFGDEKVRAILAENGWYRTVTSDLPHFTYLGIPESDLPEVGLKVEKFGGDVFWVPDL